MSKILVISNTPFSEKFNNGKTCASFFEEQSNDNIAQLYFQNALPDGTKFNKFFRITDYNLLVSIFTFGLKDSGNIVYPTQNNIESQSNLAGSKYVHYIKEFIRPLSFLRNLLFKVGLWKSKKLLNWLDEFKPTTIFLWGSDYIFPFEIAKFIMDRYNTRLLVYFADDYIIYNKRFPILPSVHKSYLNHIIPIVNRAHSLYLIGEKMQIEYKHIFKSLKSYVLLNCVELKQVDLNTIDLPENNIINFRYFGGVHVGRIDSLILLGNYLDKINERYDMNCRLEIYTFSLIDDMINKVSNNQSISVYKGLTGERLKEKIHQSHFLVHAESFDSKNKNITKFSVSTKITEYLSYQKCIVAIGPDDIASIEIFNNNDIGICITENNFENNINTLLNHINDKALYEQKVLKGIKYYIDHFDKKKMIENLLNNVC